ncbi:MAG: hypothetical protein ABJA35_07515 [Parafilimonas sp.]
MDLNTIGLWLNFIGALLLTIGTTIQTEQIMSHLRATMNYPGSPSGLVKNAVQKNITKLKWMKIGNFLIYTGYLFFIIGFLFQLVH